MIAASGLDIVEYPLLVPHLFLDVLAQCRAQPFQPRRQTRAEGHQQGHGMADVVIGLGLKRQVFGAGYPAMTGIVANRHRRESCAFGFGGSEQLVIKAHVVSLLWRGDKSELRSAHVWTPGTKTP